MNNAIILSTTLPPSNNREISANEIISDSRTGERALVNNIVGPTKIVSAPRLEDRVQTLRAPYTLSKRVQRRLVLEHLQTWVENGSEADQACRTALKDFLIGRVSLDRDGALYFPDTLILDRKGGI